MLNILGNMAHYTSELWGLLDRALSTLYFYIRAAFWGVKVGVGISARGSVYFSRRQDSCIAVGNNCNFLSRTTSNKVGIYCPCMISTIEKNALIKIGDRCGFSGVRIWAAKEIVIGDDVRCGANVFITDSDAHTTDGRAGKDAPVRIENKVWLGTNVMVLKGVHIGENSVVGAGSIVTHDIPANVIAAGNPCKVIKELRR